MSNPRNALPKWEELATTGTVTPNSRDKYKRLVMTGNVTLNPPADFSVADPVPTDEFEIHVTLGGNTLTLDAAYVAAVSPAPPITQDTILRVRVMPDKTFEYWDASNTHANRTNLDSIDQDLATTDDVTFAGMTLTTTTAALTVPRMTTTEKGNLTPVNGMIVYDATLEKFQGYENGAWVSFI